jgi:spermidine synthase
MNIDFEELDYRETPLGGLSLRRRTQLSLGVEVFEVKLGDDFLMSSLFTEGETALAELGLAGLGAGPLNVVVGGLGLGYTARAVLDHPAVGTLLVVEALPEVIEWHRRGLVPLGAELTSDPRCEFLNADFFALAASERMDPAQAGRRFDAILVDIDHSPRAVLHPAHGSFYTAAGLRRLAAHLQPHGVFGLWSNDPPDEDFRAELASVFVGVDVHVVRFHNPLQNRDASNTVYVGRARANG